LLCIEEGKFPASFFFLIRAGPADESKSLDFKTLESDLLQVCGNASCRSFGGFYGDGFGLRSVSIACPHEHARYVLFFVLHKVELVGCNVPRFVGMAENAWVSMRLFIEQLF
jgi:hypothetical protein